MATWITHMRIAEYFMNIDEQLNCVDFLVGNIAPDCGVPNEDGSGYIPDKTITHWKLDGDNQHEDFRSKYLNKTNPGFNFYLGYYLHLLIDNDWKYFPLNGVKIIDGRMKLEEGVTWENIKKDWYGQDHVYLRNNPDFVFFRMFAKIEEYPNKFFDFFPDEAFTMQIKHINSYYLTAEEDIEREFPYLSSSKMDSFIDGAINSLKNIYNAL